MNPTRRGVVFGSLTIDWERCRSLRLVVATIFRQPRARIRSMLWIRNRSIASEGEEAVHLPFMGGGVSQMDRLSTNPGAWKYAGQADAKERTGTRAQLDVSGRAESE